MIVVFSKKWDGSNDPESNRCCITIRFKMETITCPIFDWQRSVGHCQKDKFNCKIRSSAIIVPWLNFFSCYGPGARFSKVPKTFRARKAIRKTPTSLFCKAGLFICCKGNKNKNNCKVSCLQMPYFWRYKENYVTRNAPEKFRDFRETGPWF